MLSKEDQLQMLSSMGFPILGKKSDEIRLAIFPQVDLIVNLSKYPKAPKMSLPQPIASILGQFDCYIPSLLHWDPKNPAELSDIVYKLKLTMETVSGKMVHISETMLKELFQTAKMNLPLEMFFFLRLKDGVLSEYVLAPQMHRSERTVYYTSQNVDTDRTLMASCHSHPSNNYHPSQADITSFRKKPVNIIMASPFRITSMGVYDAQGTPLAFDLKQVEDADDPSEEL